MRIGAVVVGLVLGACDGSPSKPPIDGAVDAAMADAAIDAFGSCASKASCGTNHCCVMCGPGGACSHGQCADPMATRCDRVLCAPNSGSCVTKDGMTGSCSQIFPSGLWVCG